MAVPKKRISSSKKKQRLAHDYAVSMPSIFGEDGNLTRPHRKTRKTAMASHSVKKTKKPSA